MNDRMTRKPRPLSRGEHIQIQSLLMFVLGSNHDVRFRLSMGEFFGQHATPDITLSALADNHNLLGKTLNVLLDRFLAKDRPNPPRHKVNTLYRAASSALYTLEETIRTFNEWKAARTWTVDRAIAALTAEMDEIDRIISDAINSVSARKNSA